MQNPMAIPTLRNIYSRRPAAAERLRVEWAVSLFMRQVEEHGAVVGLRAALAESEKRELLPDLLRLVETGWPLERVEDIVYADTRDTRSLLRAEAAFRALGAFALETGAGAALAAMRGIGESLCRAVERTAGGGFSPFGRAAA